MSTNIELQKKSDIKLEKHKYFIRVVKAPTEDFNSAYTMLLKEGYTMEEAIEPLSNLFNLSSSQIVERLEELKIKRDIDYKTLESNLIEAINKKAKM